MCGVKPCWRLLGGFHVGSEILLETSQTTQKKDETDPRALSVLGQQSPSVIPTDTQAGYAEQAVPFTPTVATT